jgi:fatty acid desaturase
VNGARRSGWWSSSRLQIAIAWALRAQPWWMLLLAAYLVGALADHALWTLIHDCTHNLVFRKTRWNAWLQILANLPIVFPAAISFRKFHLLHHRFQGDPELDADLASPLEAGWWATARSGRHSGCSPSSPGRACGCRG